MDSKEKVLDEKRRGECFRLLAACFYKPNKLIFVQEKVFQNLTSLLEPVCPDAAHFSKKMGESFLQYSEEELTIEYAKLFVGPYELKAPPYGSVYLDPGRRVWGESTIEVVAMYKDAGLSIADDFKELPDHIVLELEFMFFLIYQEWKATERSQLNKALALRKTREQFLNRFLKPWIPSFCSKIKENTESPFYNALADCALIFIRHSSLTENSKREMPRYGVG